MIHTIDQVNRFWYQKNHHETETIGRYKLPPSRYRWRTDIDDLEKQVDKFCQQTEQMGTKKQVYETLAQSLQIMRSAAYDSGKDMRNRKTRKALRSQTGFFLQ